MIAMQRRLLFLFSLVLVVAARRGSTSLEEQEQGRKGKYFALFNVVKFNNEACTSTMAGSGSVLVGTTRTTPNRAGTCFSKDECSSKGGMAAGNCAAGFGVCCVFMLNSGTSRQNCTYLKNANFPSNYAGTSNVQYMIEKCSPEVCSLRLDFDSFQTAGPANTNEVNGGACTDTLTFSTSRTNFPVICGNNAGQHVYLDLGRDNSDKATLNFAFTGTNSNRKWDIKVTQVKCGRNNPAEGCFQYLTETSGSFQTFNFADAAGQHLANQDYTVCIRQTPGFCCIEYRPCAAQTNAFSLYRSTADAIGRLDTLCTQDWVQIQGAHACNANINQVSRICGTAFSLDTNLVKGTPANALDVPICDCTQPFQVHIHTDNTADGGNLQSRGACLSYRQLPCGINN